MPRHASGPLVPAPPSAARMTGSWVVFALETLFQPKITVVQRPCSGYAGLLQPTLLHRMPEWWLASIWFQKTVDADVVVSEDIAAPEPNAVVARARGWRTSNRCL